MRGASVEEVVANLGVTVHTPVVVLDQWFFEHGELLIQNYVGVKKQSILPTVTEVTAKYQNLLNKV